MSKLDTTALTGLRVLLNLWIMVFHALFVMMYYLPKEEVATLFSRIVVIEHGYLAVDGFFVLTGFLMALPWLAKEPDTKLDAPVTWWSDVHKFWSGRWMRVMVPYACLAVLHCFVFNRCGTHRLDDGSVRLAEAASMFRLFFPTATHVDNGCTSVWGNALHISFLMPFNGTFMHTWSLAVQYQAWLVLPVLWHALQLRQGSRLAWFTCLTTVASCLFRGLAQHHHSTPGFAPGTITGGFLELFWYSSPMARGHVIIAGMLAALVCHRYADAAHSFIKRGPQWLGWALDTGVYVLFGAFVLLNVRWAAWTGEDYRYTRGWVHTLFSSFLQVGTPLSSFVWCIIVVALVWRVGPISTWLGQALAAHMWHTPAELSFLAFLLHPMVMTYLYSSPGLLYPPSASDDRPAGLYPALLSTTVPAWGIPAAQAWFGLREALSPSGAPLPYAVMIGVHSVIGILATYLASYLALYVWERPLQAVLGRDKVRRVLRPCITGYSWAVMVIGALATVIITTAVFVWVTPGIEGAIRAHFEGLHAASGSGSGPPLGHGQEGDLTNVGLGLEGRGGGEL